MLEDGSGNVTGSYGISQVPETYALTRKGRVLAHLAGPITDSPLAGGVPQCAAEGGSLSVLDAGDHADEDQIVLTRRLRWLKRKPECTVNTSISRYSLSQC